jgi:PEGA domain
VRGVGVPRGVAVQRGFGSGFAGSRFAGSRFVGSRFASVGPVRFFRPYYAFRPRLSLGFGLWAGYPFAYPYAYYDPYYSPYGYGYGYPSAYPPYGYADPTTSYPAYPPAYPPAAGYPSSAPGPAPGYESAPGSVDVQPGQTNTGGLSFEVTPSTAQVFVDGSYVGTTGQFTASSQPLGVSAGHHRVEIRAPGYRTMTFEPDVVAGQVIPYQGTMER